MALDLGLFLRLLGRQFGLEGALHLQELEALELLLLVEGTLLPFDSGPLLVVLPNLWFRGRPWPNWASGRAEGPLHNQELPTSDGNNRKAPNARTRRRLVICSATPFGTRSGEFTCTGGESLMDFSFREKQRNEMSIIDPPPRPPPGTSAVRAVRSATAPFPHSQPEVWPEIL